jgi:hypothetical protein
LLVTKGITLSCYPWFQARIKVYDDWPISCPRTPLCPPLAVTENYMTWAFFLLTPLFRAGTAATQRAHRFTSGRALLGPVARGAKPPGGMAVADDAGSPLLKGSAVCRALAFVP